VWFPPVPGGSLLRFVLLCAALGAAACARAGGPILIGVAGPFSQPRGVSMQRAAQLAADEINTAGGIRGRPLRLVFADDSGSEDTAVRIAKSFAENPAIVAVVGHLSSNSTLAAGRVYSAGANPLVMISPSASSPDLTGFSRYVFRVTPNDLNQGQQIARFARRELGARRAGVIFINNEYGRGLRRAFTAEFTNLGGSVLEEDPYLSTSASFEPYLSRMRLRGGVDILMLACERPGADLALREARQLGLRWPVIGGDALTGIETLGPIAEGVRYSATYLPQRPGDRNARFVAAYARAFRGDHPDHRGAGAYDILYLLVRTIGAVGPDRAAIRDYIAAVGVGKPAFDGVTGTIAFDALGDVPAKPVVIGTIRNGHLEPETAR
jgi:branched-chain amino acid transport system substrate-binding protein